MEMNEKKKKKKKHKANWFSNTEWVGRVEGGGGRKSQNRILLFSCHQSPFGGSLTGVPCSHMDGIERERRTVPNARRSIMWSIPDCVSSIKEHMQLIDLKKVPCDHLYEKKNVFNLLLRSVCLRWRISRFSIALAW